MKLDLTSDINRGYEAGLGYPQTDKFMIAVHWWSFGFIVLFAITNSVLKIASYYPSPFSWRVISAPEAWGTVIIGFLAALLPTLLIGKFKNHYYWRILVTSTLTVFAYLAVFIAGGSIEMHFIFFAMIALVAIYADWRLGWFMLVLVALHHGILNYVTPTWVYFYGRNDFSVFAHAFPVIIAVIFTTIICKTHRTTIQQIKSLREDLQAINKDIKAGKK
ncbi:MAG: hypothetical protein HYS87_00470 [Candidatus Colwellbacteria bacterium]|nr:hypothetical protein [Candidatus Colwellbacteria bacterium]